MLPTREEAVPTDDERLLDSPGDAGPNEISADRLDLADAVARSGLRNRS